MPQCGVAVEERGHVLVAQHQRILAGETVRIEQDRFESCGGHRGDSRDGECGRHGFVRERLLPVGSAFGWHALSLRRAWLEDPGASHALREYPQGVPPMRYGHKLR